MINQNMYQEDSYEKVNHKSSWKFMETIFLFLFQINLAPILTRFATKEYERKIL